MEKYSIVKKDDNLSKSYLETIHERYGCEHTIYADKALIFHSVKDAEKFINENNLADNYEVYEYPVFISRRGGRSEVRTDDLRPGLLIQGVKYGTRIKDGVEWTIFRRAPSLRSGERECPVCFRATDGSEYCNEDCYSNR
jgi:hypothetical protein